MAGRISELAYIDDSAVIGRYTIVEPFAFIGPNVTIGENCYIGSYASIGSPAEFESNRFEFRAHDPNKRIVIGNNVVIREQCTVNQPCTTDTTKISDDCYIMTKSHVAHDCHLYPQVTLAASVILGGNSTLLTGSYMGIGAILHQNSTIGHYAIVAAGSIVVKDILPFVKYIPGKPLGVNTFAIHKRKLAFDDLDVYIDDATLEMIHNSILGKKCLEQFANTRIQSRHVYT